MRKSYRPLADAEIRQLRQQGCRAEDWNNVQVAEAFSPENLFRVDFYGEIRLGVFDKEIKAGGRIRRKAGIRDAELHNVTVGDNCLIEHVGSYIADYDIGDECYISHVGMMETLGPTRFANGTEIPVLQEAGEELSLTLHRKLTAQEAYILIKHCGLNRRCWNASVKSRYASADRGRIGDSVRIAGTGKISNACIGSGAAVEGALILSEVTVDSSAEAPVHIGSGCIVRLSVVSYGAELTDGAKVNRCFVGQAVHIGAGFTATDSVFFANSYMDNGEACSVVAGPFAVSHHKATLLIGCMLSFANLGSGTNMSNHLYKIGPVHYGILERGCKTASGTHLVWPMHLGAFSMAMGKIAKHVDASMFPFSYLFGKDEEVYLAPGVNGMTLGTFRDMHKWGERDRRKAGYGHDMVMTDGWMNPAVMEQTRKAVGLLRELKVRQPHAEVYAYGGMLVRRHALEKGIELYERMLSLFWGEYYIRCKYPFDTGEKVRRLSGKELPDYAEGWEDALGFPVPCSVADAVSSCMERGDAEASDAGIRFVQEHFDECLYLWQKSAYGIPDEKVKDYARGYADALSAQKSAILTDLEKETGMGDVPQALAEREKARIEACFEEKMRYAEAILSSLDKVHKE